MKGAEKIATIVETYLAEKYSDVNLAVSAKKLSDAFTHGREDLSVDYLSDRSFMAAYISHFLVTNAAKVLHCLGEAGSLGLIPKNDRLRILDIGCGPGTASLAASVFFSRACHSCAVPAGRQESRNPVQFDAIGIDQCSAVLSDAAELFEMAGAKNCSFSTVKKEISTKEINQALNGKKFDIIVASNLLNEMENDAAEFCGELIKSNLAENGFLLIIEPALRKTARPLMALRNELIENKIAHIYAPCLHENPCPMLGANDRDWCHFYVEWERPDLIRRMDETVGTDHRHLLMSYLIVGKNPPPETGNDTWRAVSSPLVSKGKKEFVMCGGKGELKKVARLDKDVSQTNSLFDEVKRGDIIECNVEKRIGKDDEFKILKKF